MTHTQGYDGGTWLYDEEFAYHGGQTRKGRAVYPDGKVRRVWGGIADTFFTVPAHGRMNGKYVAGYLYIDNDVLRFGIRGGVTK